MGGRCLRSEWCDYPERGACGVIDIPGRCTPRPEGCDDVRAPVCGCDGVTYGNECLANLAGTDIVMSGSCDGRPTPL